MDKGDRDFKNIHAYQKQLCLSDNLCQWPESCHWITWNCKKKRGKVSYSVWNEIMGIKVIGLTEIQHKSCSFLISLIFFFTRYILILFKVSFYILFRNFEFKNILLVVAKCTIILRLMDAFFFSQIDILIFKHTTTKNQTMKGENLYLHHHAHERIIN